MGEQVKMPHLSECFLSGLFSGSVVAVLSSPLDMVKVQMQLQHLSNRQTTTTLPHSSTLILGESPLINNKITVNNATLIKQQSTSAAIRYTSSWNCFSTLFREGGVKLLYRGFGPQVWREGLGFGTYFASYEGLCMLFSPTGRKSDAGTLTYFMAGGCSGMLIWAVIFPFDLVKARLQNEATMADKGGNKYSGAWDCVRKTYMGGGVKAFYSGIKPSLLRAFPVHSLIFVVYEATLNAIRGKPGPQSKT